MTKFRHEFIINAPDKLQDKTLYISMEYATVVHLCACGCRGVVSLPLSPAEWSMLFDGENISLYPSICNWGLTCESHYWIKNSEVKWARKLKQKELDFVKKRDKNDVDKYYQ